MVGEYSPAGCGQDHNPGLSAAALAVIEGTRHRQGERPFSTDMIKFFNFYSFRSLNSLLPSYIPMPRWQGEHLMPFSACWQLWHCTESRYGTPHRSGSLSAKALANRPSPHRHLKLFVSPVHRILKASGSIELMFDGI
jgi:hypothetical protein